MKTKNKTGFSGLEMAIVLLVISVLFIMVVVGFSKISYNAKIAAARALTASSPVKDIPNLALWLESTSKNSFIKSEINSSTGAISTWYDINKQSEFQNNATQATSARQPTYQTNVINGLPAVYLVVPHWLEC